MGNNVYCRICDLTARPEEVFLVISCFRCAGCGTVQSIELPTLMELESHYASYSENYTAGMGFERFNREMPKRHAAKLALVHDYLPSGKLLDIGCAEGLFLARMLSEWC